MTKDQARVSAEEMIEEMLSPRSLTARLLEQALKEARSEKDGITLQTVSFIFRKYLDEAELMEIVQDALDKHDCKGEKCDVCVRVRQLCGDKVE